MFVSLKFIVSFAIQMYNKSNIMQKEVNKLSKRQIAKRSNTDYRTVVKFLNGEKILVMKELQIKKAIVEMLSESKKINSDFNLIKK